MILSVIFFLFVRIFVGIGFLIESFIRNIRLIIRTIAFVIRVIGNLIIRFIVFVGIIIRFLFGFFLRRFSAFSAFILRAFSGNFPF